MRDGPSMPRKVENGRWRVSFGNLGVEIGGLVGVEETDVLVDFGLFWGKW